MIGWPVFWTFLKMNGLGVYFHSYGYKKHCDFFWWFYRDFCYAHGCRFCRERRKSGFTIHFLLKIGVESWEMAQIKGINELIKHYIRIYPLKFHFHLENMKILSFLSQISVFFIFSWWFLTLMCVIDSFFIILWTQYHFEN